MNCTQYYIYSNIAKDAMCFWVSNKEDFLIIPFVVFYCSSSLFKYLTGQIKISKIFILSSLLTPHQTWTPSLDYSPGSNRCFPPP